MNNDLMLSNAGSIHDSLDLFQQATALNPHNVANLKQVNTIFICIYDSRSDQGAVLNTDPSR